MLQLLGALDLPAATVFFDDRDDLRFYVLPKVPIMRREADGKAAFTYVKYRVPKELPNGDVGAALVFMDIELALTAQQEAAVRRHLAQVVQSRRGPGAPPVAPNALLLSKPQINTGSVAVEVLAGSGALVQKVNHAGAPSMFGNNVVAVSAELTQDGAPVFEAVMKGEGAGGVRVVYDLTFSARMPPITAIGTWTASKFYRFVQEVDFEENFWSEDDFTERVSEIFANSESRFVEVDPGGTLRDDPANGKAIDIITDTVTRQLDDAAKRNLLEAVPAESRDFSKVRAEDFENIRRSVVVNKVSDIRIEINQRQVISVEVHPQANMPSLTGQGFDWADYAREVDASDPFFDRFVLPIQVNADFENLPIFSVDVSIDYPPNPIETFTFRDSDSLAKFVAFRDGRPSEFKYRYVVNYTGESRTLDSGWRDGQGTDLKVNVDDLGLWLVDIEVGDMDFDEVSRAVLTLEHPEVAPGTPPVVSFQIDRNTRGLRVRELLFQPARPYGGQIKYFMKDGREFVRPLSGLQGQRFYVNDPFSARRTVQIRSVGDFERSIDAIFVDVFYDDDGNDYHQTHSAIINAENRHRDITFPVIDEKAGVVTVQTITTFRDGRHVEKPAEPFGGRTLIVGERAETLSVTVVPDLIDWDTVKLATVEIHYSDPGNGVDERETFRFRRDQSAEKFFELAVRPGATKAYTWKAVFFMVDGSRREVASPGPVTDEVIVVENAAG